MKLLSIVIPSRNREYYCIEALKDILSNDRNDFEVCICDNSDSNQLEYFCTEISDERVVYKHINGRINSVINMDTAMRMASGKYVCMIGDDDTVLSNIFDIAKMADENNYMNVTPINTINFYWPGAIATEGQVYWYDQFSSKVSMKNSDEQLNLFIRDGMIPYYNYLPRIYHGLVRNDVLKDILKRTGHVIGGLSPDIYLSVAYSCLVKEYALYYQPFTVAGACRSSATSQSNTGGHRGSLEEAPHLYRRGEYKWDCHIPKLLAVETIWTESAIKAFEELGAKQYLKDINQGYILAQLVWNNKKLLLLNFGEILDTKCYRNIMLVSFEFCTYFVARIIRYLKKKHYKRISYNNANDFIDVKNIYGSWSN